MNIDEIREILNTPDSITKNEFDIVKNIGLLVNDPDKSDVARELVLRVLEQREKFHTTKPIIEALTRAVGLFPYNDPDQLDLRDLIAYEYHRPLNMPEDFVFHREQAEVYHRLLAGDNVILSAPTSFGKSRIIDAMIATDKFNHIAVIVPTLALIDETRRRLSQFSSRYKIITHLSQRPGDRNIFVLTAERAVAYENFPKIEFFVIDEFYKIDALDEDDMRTVSLNVAFQRLLKMGGQFYMLGPNVEKVPVGIQEKYRCYFYPTRFTTVIAEHKPVRGQGSDLDRLVSLCRTLIDPTLIFCRSPARVNEIARLLLDNGIGMQVPELASAAEWAAKIYHPEWIWGQAILNGIGMHHGRLPRSIAQYTVRVFNDLKLRFLLCTSTLIEGVNTKAKNVIVFDNQIAKQKIDFFTFNNIKGRSGRMFEHFIGNVYLFAPPPDELLPFVDFPLFSQDNRTPDSLIVQIDESDLRETARERTQKWTDQDVLPISIIRENATIDPDTQIELAKHLRDESALASRMLTWNRTPSPEQLRYVCRLIWKYLVEAKRKRSGVFSDGHLVFKIWQLYWTHSCSERIRQELTSKKYAAKTPDEAVERVLQFDRVWAGFEFPRYLMALSRIQRHVLGTLGLKTGDYAFFSSQVECLFRNPVVAALDEYGIPMQVAERIQPILGTTSDLDVAVQNLRRVDLNLLSLDVFERELLEDAKQYL
ncbi:MAG: DEAD/DEAH box helicase [Phycisphaerae bacterium]